MPRVNDAKHPRKASTGRRNLLLASLPDVDQIQLRPHLRTVSVAWKQVFYEADEPVGKVVFLNAGVASVTKTMETGATVEVAAIGNEGFLGVEALFGSVSAGRVILQIPAPSAESTAEIITAADFRAAVAAIPSFRHAVEKCTHVLLRSAMQSVACNAVHALPERCARWLLLTHDRVGADQFQLSHEFLATMLGASRPSVTIVAGHFQSAGLISYRHGRVTIEKRDELERAACECYQWQQEHAAQLGVRPALSAAEQPERSTRRGP